MWVVDTCVVLDVFEDDPEFGRDSAGLLEKLLPDGLAVSPVTMMSSPQPSAEISLNRNDS